MIPGAIRSDGSDADWMKIEGPKARQAPALGIAQGIGYNKKPSAESAPAS
jgi:hypothetical protein